MSFNFGATEFKHPPKAGYVAVSQASKDCTVSSGVKGGGDKPQKLQNNAPHAVIIEVRMVTRDWSVFTCPVSGLY